MESKHRFSPQIDYLKFVFSLEYDEIQRRHDNLKRLLLNVDPNNPTLRGFKFNIIGFDASRPSERRCVFEFFGENTEKFAWAIPAGWLDNLSRIDYRVPLLHTGDEDVKSFVQEMTLLQRGRRNIYTFNTKARQKTNSRDVGGFGVMVGSRKSNQYSVLYMRAAEMAAVEFRFQNQVAEDIGYHARASIAQANEDGGELGVIQALKSALQLPVKRELGKAFGVYEVQHLEQRMRSASYNMRQMQEALEWVETQQEADWWASLTQEEQEAEQRKEIKEVIIKV